ncbi:MAG: YaiI/YqxD family protein [Thermoanaerobacteraceae bacterium]
MKILVDADACPVRDITVKIAKEFHIPVIMYADTSHTIEDDYSKTIIVDKGADSVDIALINNTEQNDIIISQDYGVAAMALSKKAYALNQNGLIYTKDNIDKLLFERHISQKIRRSGKKTPNPRKRVKADNQNFEQALKKLIKLILTAI